MSKKILIIEDDQNIIDIMTFALEEAGFSVVSRRGAGSPGEIEQIDPALILLDNHLKEGNGVDLCKVLKNNQATIHFPIVLVSANTDIELMAATAKADGLLKKPFDFEDLVAIVNKLCR